MRKLSFLKNKTFTAFCLLALLLCCSTHSKADVNYVNLTPDSTFIITEAPFQALGGSHVAIDFNGDTVIDCSFGWSSLVGGFGGDDWAAFMESGDLNSTEFLIDTSITPSNGSSFAKMLSEGDAIGSTGNWSNQMPLLGDENNGHFADQGLQFLGLRFVENGNTHYGWIEVSVHGGMSKSVTVTRYAFQDNVGNPVLAGDSISASITFITNIDVYGENGDTLIDELGGQLQMLADILPTTADDTTVTWSVTAITGAASIDTMGVLTAVANGTVKVTATSNDPLGVYGSAIITIHDPNIGLSENEDLDVWVYPNPVVDKLIVQSNMQHLEIKDISLFSIDGKRMFESAVHAKEYILDFTDQTRGLYILNITLSDDSKVNYQIAY